MIVLLFHGAVQNSLRLNYHIYEFVTTCGIERNVLFSPAVLG